MTENGNPTQVPKCPLPCAISSLFPQYNFSNIPVYSYICIVLFPPLDRWHLPQRQGYSSGLYTEELPRFGNKAWLLVGTQIFLE